MNIIIQIETENLARCVKDEEEVTVYINSPGGNVFEGHAIYNLLAELKDRLTIKIIGQASSIASEISCAAQKGKTLIAANASMLIHYPWTFGMINEKYLDRLKKELVNVKESIFTSYISKTGMKAKQLEDIMSKEERFSAKDCVEMGFADEVWNPAAEEKDIIKESEDVNNKVFEQFRAMTMQNLAKLSNPKELTELNIYIDKKLITDLHIGGDMPDTNVGQGGITTPEPKENTDIKALLDKNEILEAQVEKLRVEKQDFIGKYNDLKDEFDKLEDKYVVNNVDNTLENLKAGKKILPVEVTEDGIVLDLGGVKITRNQLVNLKRNESTIRLNEEISVYEAYINQIKARPEMGGLNANIATDNKIEDKPKVSGKIKDFKDFAKVVMNLENDWQSDVTVVGYIVNYAKENQISIDEASEELIRKVEGGE